MELPQQAWLFRGQSFLDKEEIYSYIEAECQRLIDSCNFLKDFTLPGWHRAYLEDKASLKQEPNKLNKFLRTKTAYYRAMNQYKREKSLLKELRTVYKKMKADDNLKSKKYYPLRVKESLYMRKAERNSKDKKKETTIPAEFQKTIQTGTFTDPRDGQTYKTVEINGQIWMTENLRFEGVECFAPNGNKDKIPEYGCLYKWEDAINACPEGWHLPSKEEFKALLTYVGSDDSIRSKNLRAHTWRSGVDKYGFRALPAGYCCGVSDYFFGSNAYFWSATEDDSDYAYNMGLGNDLAGVTSIIKDNGSSVRCIKD